MLTPTILKEHLTFSQSNFVVESEDNQVGGKDLYMKGIFIQGGIKNHNERTYPVHEIQKAVETLNKVIVENKGVPGECDHPSELTINIDRVSHVITKMWMDGSDGAGKLKIIPTPCGQIIRTLIESGVRLGVSSRGAGNVDDRGEVSGFEIITVDIVVRPSAPDAYPKPIYESFNTRRGQIIEDLAKAAIHDPKALSFLQIEMMKAIDQLKF